MATPIKFDPPLVMDLGDNPSQVEFKNVDELEKWASDERTRWSRVFGALQQQNTTLFQQVKCHQTRYVDAIIEHSRQLKASNPSGSPSSQNMENFRKLVTNQLDAFRDGRVIHSDGKNGQLVLGIDDNVVAMDVLAVLQRRLGGSIRSGETFDMLALLDGWRIAHGEEPNGRAEAAAMKKAAEDAAVKLAEATVAYNDVRKKLDDTLVKGQARNSEAAKQLAEKLTTLDASMKATQDAAGKSLDEKLKELKAEVDKTQQFYEKQMSIQRPVMFWRGKAASHTKNSLWWAVGFGVVVVLSIVRLEVWGVRTADEILTAGNHFNPAPWRGSRCPRSLSSGCCGSARVSSA